MRRVQSRAKRHRRTRKKLSKFQKKKFLKEFKVKKDTIKRSLLTTALTCLAVHRGFVDCDWIDRCAWAICAVESGPLAWELLTPELRADIMAEALALPVFRRGNIRNEPLIQFFREKL